jgi:hypothetical protein
VLVAGLSVLLAVVLAEVGLRVLGIGHPRFTVYDETYGWVLRPGATGWYTNEGRGWVSINSQGLRDDEHTFAKPPETLRIAVLGDSYTAAFQLPVEQNFSSVIERELTACPTLTGKTVETLNFGVPGYSTVSELLTLRYRVWQYEPDIVVLAYYPGNDLEDNFRVLANETHRKYFPFFTLQDGQLVLDDSFKQRLPPRSFSSDAYWYAYDQVRLLQVLQEERLEGAWSELVAASRRQEYEPVAGSADDEVALRVSLLEKGLYSPPSNQKWLDAWSVTEAMLLAMRDEIAARGAKFLLVTLSDGVDVYPDPAERERVMHALQVDTPFYQETRLEAFGARNGIAALGLGKPFQAYADAHRVFLHGFANSKLGTGHWSAEGHRLGGELIARELCERVLRP